MIHANYIGHAINWDHTISEFEYDYDDDYDSFDSSTLTIGRCDYDSSTFIEKHDEIKEERSKWNNPKKINLPLAPFYPIVANRCRNSL
jgi:hypothetical protein